MPFGMQLALPSRDWHGLERSPYTRLYLGAVFALLDEAWLLLCAVSLLVKGLLGQIHVAKQREWAYGQSGDRLWLQLSLHLLAAQPRFERFHAAACDFVACCHQLRSAGFVELGAHIPTIPAGLLDLFADLGELVHVPPVAAWAGEKEGKVQRPESLSSVSTSAGSMLYPLERDLSSLTSRPSLPEGLGGWEPSSRVLDALRTVDSLQCSPLLTSCWSHHFRGGAAGGGLIDSPVREGSTESSEPHRRGYTLLDEENDAWEPLMGSRASLSSPAGSKPRAVALAGGRSPSRNNSNSGISAPDSTQAPAAPILSQPPEVVTNPVSASPSGSELPPWAAAICQNGSRRCQPLFVAQPGKSMDTATMSAAGTQSAAPVDHYSRGPDSRGEASEGTVAAASVQKALLQTRPDSNQSAQELVVVPLNPFELSTIQLQRATSRTICREGSSEKPQLAPTPQARDLAEGAEGMIAPHLRARTPSLAATGGVLPEKAVAAVAMPATATNEIATAAAGLEGWEVDPAELALGELLGSGSTAEVFRASWHGTDVAVKRLLHAGALSAEVSSEISILLRLRHPNLVLFMGCSLLRGPPMIVSELCAGGTVFALLHQQLDLPLPWSQRLKVAVDVAKGMNFLHRRRVVHRDLKSLNLLLAGPVTRTGDLPPTKVSDFGLSRAWPAASQAQAFMTRGAGTYHWMAPEVLGGLPYNEKVDVYSYGICLYELAARCVPYAGSGLEPVAIAVAVSQGRRPDLDRLSRDCPGDLRLTMECCWAHSPRGRPGFDTVLETLKLIRCPPWLL